MFLLDDQLVLLKAVLDTIETDNLLENTMKSGDTLLSGLLDLQVCPVNRLTTDYNVTLIVTRPGIPSI